MSDCNLSAFLWSVADLLRGDYKQFEYGKVILPFTVLRRLDCMLEPTKAALDAHTAMSNQAFGSPKVRAGLKEVRLNQAGLYEALCTRTDAFPGTVTS